MLIVGFIGISARSRASARTRSICVLGERLAEALAMLERIVYPFDHWRLPWGCDIEVWGSAVADHSHSYQNCASNESMVRGRDDFVMTFNARC